MPYYYDINSLMIMLPAFLFALFASFKVKSSYNKYSRIKSDLGMTGAQVAKQILNRNGIYDINIVRINGTLTDYYDSKSKILALSSGIYDGNSIASISVAAHESGHAVQMAEGYVPLIIRHAMVGITNIATNVSYMFIILGLLVSEKFATIGIIMFLIIFLFQVVTLPVEINASHRALDELVAIGVSDKERKSCRNMLKSAAMTYVAAMATALSELIRVINMFNRRRD